jgi:hypothetical protein
MMFLTFVGSWSRMFWFKKNVFVSHVDKSGLVMVNLDSQFDWTEISEAHF